jgi:hypothetical protein
MTANAPSGVVTFLFTDVEGSTRRWEADADARPGQCLTQLPQFWWAANPAGCPCPNV